MANIFAWLLAAVWPLARQVLVSLGIGWLTYSAMSSVGAQIQTAVSNNLGAMPTGMLQFFSLLGGSEAVGILLAAISARIALAATGRLGRLTK